MVQPDMYLNERATSMIETVDCGRCGTELAKNDDARREEDGEVYYLCDDCIAEDNSP